MTQDAVRKVVVTWGSWKDRIPAKALAEGFGDVEFVISDDRAELLEAARDADAAFIAGWDAEMHRAAGKLRWIHAVGGGVSLFEELVDSDIPLSCGKPAFAIPGAEYALAAMLMFSRRSHVAVGAPPMSTWDGSQDEQLLPVDLAGKTVGVIGMGGMGQALAPRANGLGMRVFGTARRSRTPPEGVERMFDGDRLMEMLGISDFVVVAVPINDETRGMIDEQVLKGMKETAYLIDCSGRTALFDYPALERAVSQEWIAGVCLQPSGGGTDVPPAGSTFWKRENVVVTPCRGTSAEQEEECLALFFENLRLFEAGRPLKGLVDKKSGY